MDPLSCTLCPRMCHASRKEGHYGFCGMSALPTVAKAMVHRFEEPCISGQNGTGAVFFSGCVLQCVFCQNASISLQGYGKEISPAALRNILEGLVQKGVHTISLITPTQFVSSLLSALTPPLPVPVVYNTGGYERVETLRLLKGKIQIYLPDLKYALAEPAARYSGAADYFDKATKAILEMYHQVGRYRLGPDGILQKGVLIRHLVLPGEEENTKAVIDWVCDTFPRGHVLFSLMGQYTPPAHPTPFANLNRRLSEEEYQQAASYLLSRGWEDGYLQDLSSAESSYTPTFDLEGID